MVSTGIALETNEVPNANALPAKPPNLSEALTIAFLALFNPLLIAPPIIPNGANGLPPKRHRPTAISSALIANSVRLAPFSSTSAK